MTGITFDTHRVYKVTTANNYTARREIIRANWVIHGQARNNAPKITDTSYLHPKYFTVKFYGFIPISDFKNEM